MQFYSLKIMLLIHIRWKALCPSSDDERQSFVDLASVKLINSVFSFNPSDIHQVFAVLSQRLCLEPVLVASEAIKLADHSVANHMRVITGISDDRRTFHTYSPSEPILVLGAINLMYVGMEKSHWGCALDTFTKKLCSAGLVEKGLIGELAARLLLILARDDAAPKGRNFVPNLLEPVSLIDVLDALFGNKTWADKYRSNYEGAFSTAYVNFTHWILTKDPLPEDPDQ